MRQSGKRNEDGDAPLNVDLAYQIVMSNEDLWRPKVRRLRGYRRSSLERRWSSRRFPYGYLVTTSPQSLTLPWPAASLTG